MTGQPLCAEDDCHNPVEDNRIEWIEVPVEGIGQWIETGETDEEYGLELTEWTGEWETVHAGICAECHEREQRLFEELSSE